MQDFAELGYCQIKLTLPDRIIKYLEEENWHQLDFVLGNYFAGDMQKHLKPFTEINAIEHIISIRKDPDEEGIWHDDGTRKLAFTLSLTKDVENIKGGVLNFRKRGELAMIKIPTPPLGTLTIFKTGIDNYEHQLTKVEKGRRIISAGWIT